MNQTDLYNQILNLFPTTQTYNGNYREELRSTLKGYQNLISSSSLFSSTTIE